MRRLHRDGGRRRLSFCGLYRRGQERDKVTFVTKGQSLLIGACVVLTILSLVIPSSIARLVLAGLVLVIAVVWAVAARSKTTDARNQSFDQTQSPENFE